MTAVSEAHEIVFSSREEITAHFKAVPAIVGPRRGPNKRTKAQEERYNLRQYLLTLAEANRLAFPLRIRKGERPDYLIAEAGEEPYGLEITQGTTSSWQRELTLETRPDAGELVASLNDTDDETHEETVVATLLSGDGFVDDDPERDTCAAVLRAMRRKARLIRRGGYQPAARHDVLIYINVRAFF